MREISATLAEL